MKRFIYYIHQLYSFLWKHFEAFAWITALALLFFMPAASAGNSLCLLRFAGFSHCWGCGIGHAMRDAMHGAFVTSFHYHPLGIPAVLIIFIRIKQLLITQTQTHETKSH